MPKKLELDLDLSADFTIIGLCSTLPDYRLAWHINQVSSINLIKKENFNNSNKADHSGFSFFMDESNEVNHYYLFQNKHTDGILFAKHKNIDYLLFIKDLEGADIYTSMLDQLKKINQITFSYRLENNSFQHLDHFLSELEVHIINIQKRS